MSPRPNLKSRRRRRNRSRSLRGSWRRDLTIARESREQREPNSLQQSPAGPPTPLYPRYIPEACTNTDKPGHRANAQRLGWSGRRRFAQHSSVVVVQEYKFCGLAYPAHPPKLLTPPPSTDS